MTMHVLWKAITGFYQPTLELIDLWAWGLPMFVLVAAIMFATSRARAEPLGPKAIFAAAFPREQHVHASARVDRWNGILLLLLGFPLLGLIALNGVTIAGQLAESLNGTFGAHAPLFRAAWAIVTLQFLTYFLTMDFAGYWVHRWCHTVSLLWNLHKPHHTAETLTPWTLFRQHPIEVFILNALPAIFAGLCTGVLMHLIGTPLHPGTVASVGILTYVTFFVIDVLSHFHLPVSFGWLDRIILAPVMHNLHHSLEVRHRDMNNAVVLTLWDWMFGTLYLPTKGETWRWGLNETEYGPANPHRTLRGFYLEPFASFGGELSRSIRGSRPSTRDRQA